MSDKSNPYDLAPEQQAIADKVAETLKPLPKGEQQSILKDLREKFAKKTDPIPTLTTVDSIVNSAATRQEKINQVSAILAQLYKDRDVLDAVKAMVFGDHGRWKEHADKLESMVEGASLDEATMALTRRVAHLKTTVSIDQTIPEVVPFLVGLLQWRRESCPHFALAPDFFHALSVTDYTTKDDTRVLQLPFHAFTMAFPKSPLLGNASRLFVYRIPGLSTGTPRWKWWRVTMYPEVGTSVFSQWDDGITRGAFAGGDPDLDAAPKHGARPLEDWEKGLMRPARILIANVLAFIEAKGPLPEKSPDRHAPPAALERAHPQRSTWDVGRSVKLDGNVRRALIASANGGDAPRWKLSQRYIVRGHWRRQAYGPQWSQHKDLWIEPFYKGPADVEAAIDRLYSVGGSVEED